MTTLESLIGTRIDRIDAPARDLLVFTLRKPDLKGALLANLSGPARGVGWVDRRPKGEPATGAVSKLRHHLSGARIEAFVPRSGRVLDVQVSRTKRAACLRLVLGQAQGNAIVLDAAGKRLVSLHAIAPHHEFGDSQDIDESDTWPRDLSDLRRAGKALTSALAPEPGQANKQLSRAVRRKLTQLERRLAAIQRDGARVSQAEPLRQQANALLASLHALPKRAREVEVPDPAQAGRTMRLALQPGLTPSEQADAWFKRARKLERGARIAAEREAATRAEIEEARAQLVELAHGTTNDEDMAARVQALGIALPSQDPPPRQGNKPGPRQPYRTFLSHDGARILVGRGAADNDALTLHHAAPDDVWLHTRGAAGAHVVVPVPRGKPCSPAVLLDAALLAAHFSKFKHDSRVEIAHTLKRHVRKPKGSPAGLVRVDREKVLLLRPDAERLRQLLDAELKT